MSSAMNETVSSNQNWKKAGRKTKRGKPTGRREVVEKYKAIGLDTLGCGNRKQQAIRGRVFGYVFNEPSIVAPMLAKERRRANKPALQDQLLSLENKESQEESWHEARGEVIEMMDGICRENSRGRAQKLGLEPWYFELPRGLEDVDWFGFDYGHLSGEFWDNLKGVIGWAREQGNYVDFEQAAWMAAPHFGGEDCFICKKMAEYGELGYCRWIG
ncbi:hypothetical protein INS49_004980 [Diaporthe citri]|uniref:uncharacterized protein n=1 Tax=Diaporthe citri TaxID=83186 RepID=UPI001C7E4073|nr:uncharacterized protein INS49_004980 [Diaporthe citri]KAG6354009.1 hypothetical protein INS49_004980 [Diaporthe citri]